ncbi:hypothetical protein BV923_09620 [Pectobacterium odoriferum]|uniref:hypothetical protein n=1 Tax=Pectobacterium odoriferum TaxID=78398 RepID=UPI000CCFD992|nr:hypothetical protein [Pectobacterium odoriferum]POE22834.1 hypothetical protein BV923_09620 [Pectobacterium odoriferum]
MKERGMIFNAEMVRATLSEQKTQTRRIVKLQPDEDGLARLSGGPWMDTNEKVYPCPYGEVGDKLWVRETWQVIHDYTDEYGNVDERRFARSIPKQRGNYWHPVYAERFGSESRDDRGFPWRPAIYMPRWASRITLEITDVRVERLNDISEEDAKAEGAPTECCVIGYKHFLGFRTLWKSIYGAESWNENPWVWVIEFKQIK